MVTVQTGGLGQALGIGNSIYGSGQQNGNTANTGLRTSYQWGLWTYCAKSGSLGGVPDYCDGTSWAHEFRPVPAILFDVPAADQTEVANRLPGGVFTDDSYLGRYT